MHLTPMPSALLARRLRSRLWCQKQVGAGDRGRSALALLISTGILIALYLASYYLVTERDSSRARGVGMYFHYRFLKHDLLATIFLPAAWLESEIIQIYPQPFLPDPSWAAEPQALIFQSPHQNIHFSSGLPNSTGGRDLMSSKYIHDENGNVFTIQK